MDLWSSKDIFTIESIYSVKSGPLQLQGGLKSVQEESDLSSNAILQIG